jgi:hypothetical protein
MNRPQVGSYYFGRGGGALCHAVTGNKGAKCVFCYERDEMATKGIIPDKAITRFRTI